MVGGRGGRPALVEALGQTVQAGGAAPGREAEDCDRLYWVAGRELPGLLWGQISWSCLSASRAKQLGVL